MMMKLTFEGKTLGDILDEMQGLIDKFKPGVLTADPGPVVPKVTVPKANALVSNRQSVEDGWKEFAGSSGLPLTVVDKPVEKKARTEKQLANDEKMRVAALERVAAKRAAKAAGPQVHYAPEPVEERPDPIGKEPEVDPVELVKLRQKTIEELQAAYANGHQKEVFELLSRFGNGAKSFRELPPESFMPIRRAIDLGALE